MRKLLVSLPSALLASAALGAGTLTVTSPTDGAFVGSNTTINFRISGGDLEVTVTATIRAMPSGSPSTTLQTRVQPDSEGNANGSMTWRPSNAFPEGPYEIKVEATEPGNTYNTVIVNVTLDTVKPEIVDFAPVENAFVRGVVNITATIQELNIDTWRVTVNDEDLPNNTGSSNNVLVAWDTAGIEEDGAQTIKIIVKDRAGNEQTKDIHVTLDRASPEIIVLFPRSNQPVPPGTILGVAFNVADSSDRSVDVTAISVVLRDMSNNFLKRVARSSYARVNDTTAKWTGMVRITLPPNVSQFKLVISAVDRAGNPATTQEVPLVIGRGRGR